MVSERFKKTTTSYQKFIKELMNLMNKTQNENDNRKANHKENFKRSKVLIFVAVCLYFSFCNVHVLKKYTPAPNSPVFNRKLTELPVTKEY